MATIKNKYSSTVTNSIPLAPSSLQYGEIAFNIATGYESLFLKNSSDAIITLNDWTHILSKPTTMTGYGLNDFTAHSATLIGTVAGATVLDVRGTNGQLFSVTDSLVGSLLTISDISGIPIFDVNSSGLVDIDGDLQATGEITAYGLGNGSVAYAYNRLDTWTGYTTAFDEYVLSAKLGYELHEKPAYAITSTNITNWGTAYSHVSNINNPHGVTPTQLGLVIGTNVLAYRTFGSAANSATTDFVAYRTFGTAANSATTDFATAAQGTDARTPTAHAFIDSTGHTASGLTTGHFLKATGTTTYGFAAHGLSYGDVDAEQAFTKNTGFNKNFGTTTGTVLEGRTFGTAAASNVGDFIQNQSTSAQTAIMWISGAINGSSSILNNLTAGSVVLEVRGTNGQLFSVTDSLVGDIFTVSDISGIPIFNVNSNGTIDADGDFIATGEVTAYGVGTGTTSYAYDRMDTWSYDAGKVDWVLSAYLGNDLYTRPSYAITSTNITNWNSAFGWGNHASSGYLTGITKAQVEAVLTGAITTHTHAYVEVNTAITAATKTKISYDAKGLVTGGGDATTADIADDTNKRYVTDAHITLLGNTSNTNSGDAADNSQYSALITSKTAKHVYAAPNAADGVPGFRALVASDIPSLSYASPIHNLIDTTNHPVTGLTAGHFLKATGATTYGFAAHGLGASDVGARADTWLPPNDHVAATVTTTNGLSISGQEISLALSSTSVNGALSSTDWNTFNAKQSVLTGTATSVTATTTLYTLATSSGKTMVVDYYIINSAGTAQRGGTQVITWTSTLLSYTETSTTDIGLATNAVQMIPVISGSNLLVQAAITSGTWSVKCSVRFL